jgi:hypothetical protein
MPEEAFRCTRCGSNRFVSVSFDGGFIRRPQCVPCGKVDGRFFGYGSNSPKWDKGWTRVTSPAEPEEREW